MKCMNKVYFRYTISTCYHCFYIFLRRKIQVLRRLSARRWLEKCLKKVESCEQCNSLVEVVVILMILCWNWGIFFSKLYELKLGNPSTNIFRFLYIATCPPYGHFSSTQWVAAELGPGPVLVALHPRWEKFIQDAHINSSNRVCLNLKHHWNCFFFVTGAMSRARDEDAEMQLKRSSNTWKWRKNTSKACHLAGWLWCTSPSRG